jgi:hypothetical protein
MQADAASDAADTQANASRESVAEQRRQYDLTRADYAPYREAGVRSLGTLEGEISRMPTSQEVMSQPGYQFGLEQGQRAIDRKIAASGGRVSGQAIKQAARFGTDYAATGYNAEYQRRQDRLNRLAALAGVGQSATGASAAAGTNSANAISGILQSKGDAAGAAQMARGNIWGNAANSIGAQGMRAYQNNQFGGGISSYQDIAQSGNQGYINPITYGDNYG